METAVRFVSGLFILLAGAVIACTDGRPERSPSPRPQALEESIEAGYERLQRAYATADTLPASVQQMRGAMGQMHGQMRRHRQRMEAGRREGRGMRGGQRMHGEGGMHGGQHHQRRHRRVRRDSVQMWEWHQQMMGMHAQMMQMHEQRGQAKMAKRHRQMERRHRRMMEALPSGDDVDSAKETTPPPSDAERPAVSGADLYVQQCATCHGQDGAGLGPFPPLEGSQWVVGDDDTAIRILLHGLQGRITVDDRVYNNVMPAFGRRLSDDEIAALLSFVRSSWGNEAEAIDPSDVSEVRQQHSGRDRPWSANELRETE